MTVAVFLAASAGPWSDDGRRGVSSSPAAIFSFVFHEQYARHPAGFGVCGDDRRNRDDGDAVGRFVRAKIFWQFDIFALKPSAIFAFLTCGSFLTGSFSPDSFSTSLRKPIFCQPF